MTTEELEDRLRTTYATALRAQHHNARVEIRVSDDVREAFGRFAEERLAFDMGVEIATAWGYPIVVDESLPADTIQVHSVTSIY